MLEAISEALRVFLLLIKSQTSNCSRPTFEGRVLDSTLSQKVTFFFLSFFALLLVPLLQILASSSAAAAPLRSAH